MQQILPNHSNNQQKIYIQQVSYRWIIFFVFALCTFVDGMVTVTVAPISNKLVETYQVTTLEINIISMLFKLEFGIINLPANFFIDDHGIRIGMLIGTVFMMIGSGLSMIVNQNFSSVIIGQLLIGIGQPFILNCCTKIPTFWFFKQNRVNVVNALTLFNLIGTGFGFVVPTLIVDQNAATVTAKNQVFQLFMIYFIITVICLLLVIVLMKNKPDKPPSYGSKCDKTLFKQSLRQLKQNKNFIILFFAYSIFIGPLSTLASLMNFLLSPYYFSDLQISIFGIIVLLSGLIGSTLASYYVSKTLRYDLMSRTFTIISVISITILLILLKLAIGFAGICTIVFFLGFFITPLFPLSYDFGCQLSFPVGQAQATGIINSGGYLFSFILIIILQFSINFGTQQQSFKCLIVLAVMMFVGSMLYFFVKNDLKRRNLEEKKQIQHKETQIPSEQKIKSSMNIIDQQIQL